MKKLVFLLFCFSFIINSSFSGQGENPKNNKAPRITINDQYKYVSVNQILMWISNNGDGSHDPRTDGNGFYWPGGINATQSAVFEDGLVFGGMYNGEVRFNGNTHRQGLQAGKILPNGIPDNPTLGKYRIYKILRGWENLPPGPARDEYQLDYEYWPIEDGAPYIDINGNGSPDPGIDLPQYVGDETAWYVANDMDPARSLFTYGTMPMGLEFQTTVFAFKDQSYEDMIFKKYLMINKGDRVIQDMYIGYWNDVDLGDANDDYAGCDTSQNLSIMYNATNNDGTYGTPPPAIAYDLLQGPIVPGNPDDTARFQGSLRQGFKNLPMTSFVFMIGGSATYRDPSQGMASGSTEFYNYMQGLVWNGEQFIDPHTAQPVKYLLAGDPVAHTGWYEGSGWPNGPSPGDRRELMSSGPFTLSPGDTQEIIIGIVIAKGLDNINSITALREKDLGMKDLYNNNFIITGCG